MFDINEYYIEKDLIRENDTRLDIMPYTPESAIESDIHRIIHGSDESDYSALRFKRNFHAINIFTPELYCPFAGEFSIHPDYFRFLLSVYPDAEDLLSIQNIIFRPRYVESGGVQLVSLYSTQYQTLLLYFSYPHAYSYSDYNFFTNRNTEIDISSITDHHYLGTAAGRDETLLTIPPLFYIIKMISRCPNNSIDKYLLRLGSSVDSQKITLLEEISCFYNRHGY